MLTRDTIEKILNGECTSNKISIRSALETALALYDENADLKRIAIEQTNKRILADEEIKHAYEEALREKYLSETKRLSEHAMEISDKLSRAEEVVEAAKKVLMDGCGYECGGECGEKAGNGLRAALDGVYPTREVKP